MDGTNRSNKKRWSKSKSKMMIRLSRALFFFLKKDLYWIVSFWSPIGSTRDLAIPPGGVLVAPPPHRISHGKEYSTTGGPTGSNHQPATSQTGRSFERRKSNSSKVRQPNPFTKGIHKPRLEGPRK